MAVDACIQDHLSCPFVAWVSSVVCGPDICPTLQGKQAELESLRKPLKDANRRSKQLETMVENVQAKQTSLQHQLEVSVASSSAL